MTRPSVNAIHPLRRAYFVATVVLVAVGLPLLYAYTGGLRFSPGGSRIVQTGALVVDSEPSGATVTVNGRMATDRTPLRAPALTPGRYRVELSKTGYVPWAKTLTVEPGRATLALSVQLLRVAPIVETLGPALDQASLDPTGSVLLERRDRSWSLRRVGDNSVEDLGPGSAWTRIKWAADGRRLLVETAAGTELLTVGVPSRLSAVPESLDAAFDPLDPDSILLASAVGVDRWSPTAHVRQPLREENAIGVAAIGTRIAWQRADGTLASAPRTVSGGIGTPISKLPGTRFGPWTTDGTLISVDASTTYLLPNADPSRVTRVPTLARNATELRGMVALASKDELWAGSSPELLYRSSELLDGLAWLPGGSLVAIQAGSAVLAVELDGRDQRNTVELYRADGVRLIGTDATGRLILLQPKTPGVKSPGLMALTAI